MPKRERVTFEITAEDRASRAVRKVRDEFAGLGDVATSIKLPFASIAKGAAAAGAGVAATALAVTGMVKALAPYNRAINEARSLTGESVGAFSDLRREVLSLSADLGTDPTAQAKALYEALSAGVPRDNAVEFLGTATKAAVAGLTETKVAVDGITTVLNAYNLESSQAEKISDAFFATIEKGKTNFEQLASSINVAVKPAANLGVEYQELLSIVAQLTAGGTPTAAAFTQIRAALTSLQNPSKEMAALLKRQGFESGRAAIEAQGLATTLQKLKDEAADDQELVKALGRVEALGAVLGVSGTQAASFAEKYERVMESAGAASAAFAINSDNLDNRLQQLSSTFLVAADGIDQYLGKLANAQSISQLATDGLGGLSNILQAKLDPLKFEVDTDDLDTAFVETEARLKRLREIIADRPESRPSIFGNISEQDKETARLLAQESELKRLQDEIKKRAKILTEGDEAVARSNAALSKLQDARERILADLNALDGGDIFGEGGAFSNRLQGVNSAIEEKERELRALKGITEEQYKASLAGEKAAEVGTKQAENQEQLNGLLSEFLVLSKTKEDLAREELKAQSDRFAVLLEEGKVTKEQYGSFVALQREKLGLLDEETAKREKLSKQQAEQAAKEAGRLKSDNERLASRFLDRVRTGQEQLVKELAEVARLQEGGFLSQSQGSQVGQRLREEFARSQADITTGFDEMASAADSFRERVKTPLERLKDDIREVQTLTGQGLFTEGENTRIINRMVEQFNGGAQEIQSAWDDTVGVLRSGFSSFLRGGADDFGEFIASLIAEASALQAERLLFGDEGLLTLLRGGAASKKLNSDSNLFDELQGLAESNFEDFDSLGQVAGANFGEAFSVSTAPPISKGLASAAAKAKDLLLPAEPGIDPGAFALLGGSIQDDMTELGETASRAFADSFSASPDVASIQTFQIMEDAGKAAADRTAASFEDSNKTILESLSDIANKAVSVLGNVARKIGTFVGNLFGGGGGSGVGFNFDGLLTSIFSFDGGGFTGMGTRSGGVDGFGGFPAILHPNEQVVDLSRGQSMPGGVTIGQTLNIQPGVSSEMIPQILAAAKEGTMAAIRDQGLRGGRRARTLGF